MFNKIIPFNILLLVCIVSIVGCTSAPPTAATAPTRSAPTAVVSATEPSATAAPPSPAPTDNAAGNASALDACAIFTPADAEALLSKSVQKKPSPVTAPFASVVSTCFYQATGSLFDSAELIVRELDTPADAQKAYAQTMSDLKSAGLEPTAVNGLGEQANWLGAAPNKQLHVLQGKWILIFTVVGQTIDDAKWASAVRQMLSRLP